MSTVGWGPSGSGGGTSSDVAITDGSSSTIKATVKDYADSNPLTVVLVDTNGDAYTAGVPVGGATAANQVLEIADLDKLAAQVLDYDTGAGTASTVIHGIALPASGGPVAGGTATNPIRVDPTGTTAQPITDNGGSITVDGPLTDTQLRASAVPVSAASLPLPALAATSAKQSDGTQKTQLVDGSGNIIGSTSNALDINIKSGNPTTIAATQSGTWNITNVSGTVSLPTGASTAAKQPALGTAGTASADVITIQGIASMTKLLVTPDSVALPANQSVNVNQINSATPAGIANLGTYTYGTKTTLTTSTNYKSLANGSGWSGGSITTSGNKAIRFRIQTKGQSSGTNYVDFYLATSINGETTFDDAASATADQAFTAANRLNSRYLGSIKMNAATAVTGSLDSSDVFNTLPGAIVLIAINNSGAALSTTAGDHIIDYELVK